MYQIDSEGLLALLNDSQLTLSEVAMQIGVNRKTISRLLHQSTVPNLELVWNLVDYFQLNDEQILALFFCPVMEPIPSTQREVLPCP